ncbi:MocR-like pyridoxine biosynthesis transcription factor PdxR [Singulisphaera acidiphila]|uniref:Transcriptional regulator with HTH domain and aminotransferase domain n=3 Tax=Singulisphaera acidiphila TaxID=466153 RepID=L0DHS6_SINAD|nr:PLP-dependent aminotransferase family protein [Singulisphaera acidiphila]AGA28919.1 transcriptional regulator with HTH domain and aminotransferase domain [Singulisphaera acidiphila DSM 18658]
MAKGTPPVSLLAIPLDASSAAPLFRQLYDGLRGAILSGSLKPGGRLPASRTLAGDLGVSRNTVTTAYDQLLAEGYLEGKVGAGTYVTRTLPEDALLVRRGQARGDDRTGQPGRLSRRGTLLATTPAWVVRGAADPKPFRPGVPAMDTLPLDAWATLAARHWRRSTGHLLGYGDPAGYGPLREAIAAHLGTARGVVCEAGQVVIVAGTQQAIDLATRLLLDPGDPAWIEDPGFVGARGAVVGAGARLVPVPVDGDGMVVSAGVARCPEARLAYVTPSHQYPLGVAMTLARRLELLCWAHRAGAWILEDDYDSEFRYTGRPLASLQGLDQQGRVVYMGTFSKVLFPALRLSYLVAPPGLVNAFVAALALAGGPPPLHTQAVLADFFTEGHFLRHIRRMRALYAERQEALVRAAKAELCGLLEVVPSETGLQVMSWLDEGINDRAASRWADAAGVVAPPLSSYTLEPSSRQGLLLGYAAHSPRQIREGMRRLATALHCGVNTS